MNKQNSNGFFILGAALILTIGLFFMGFFIFKSNNAQSPYGMANSISVMGEGKTMVKPDMLVINLSVSELADTTELAQTQSNEKINKVRELLSGLNIPENSLKTTSVNVSPEYDWSEPSGRKLLGYRSQHSLTINVSGEDFGVKGGDIVDAIAKIGGVEVNGTYFDLRDKDAALAIAREEALQNAKEKAEQLAKASGGKLGKVLTIQDNSYYNSPRPYYANDMKTVSGMGAMEEEMEEEVVSAQALSPGEIEMVANVNVVYKIK